MKEKIRFSSTPFPMQVLLGEQSRVTKTTRFKNEGVNEEIAKEFKLKPDRKGLRTVIRDTSQMPKTVTENFKYFIGRRGSISLNPDISGGFLDQGVLSSVQGILHTVLHQPRLSTLDKELVIINVEGVIANFQNKEVSIRGESVHVLKELNGRYQVVLVSGWKLARYLKLITFLSSKGIYISAAYKHVTAGGNTSEGFHNKRHEWYLDYNRVYKDFKVTQTNIKKVFVLVPFSANPEEISLPSVSEKTGSLRPVFFIQKGPVPTAQYPFTPISILVPHMAVSPVHIGTIPEVIKQLTTIRFLSNFYHRNLVFFSSDVLHKELLYLYHKSSLSDLQIQNFVLLKSGNTSEITFVHKETVIQRLNFESLLEFTLNINN